MYVNALNTTVWVCAKTYTHTHLIHIHSLECSLQDLKISDGLMFQASVELDFL